MAQEFSDEPVSEYRKFKELHGCAQCYYKQSIANCFKSRECFLSTKRDRTFIQRSMCPKDYTSDCPYGNDAGTCFGFCMREIIQEHRERKRKHEQTEEDKKDDG